MFPSLLWFEIKNRLIRPSSFIYFSIYFALSFFSAIAFAGAFKGVVVDLMLSNRLALNSPMVIQYLTSGIGYLGLLVIAPLFGQSINQDFETGFHRILFATPIRKSTYFFVRFFASFLSALAILLSIGLGIWVATLMPFIDQMMVAENRLWFYVAPYLCIIIPNIFLFGALFLAVISLFKKMASVYIASIVVFVGYMLAGNLLIDLDNQRLAALIDPFGVEAMKLVTRYWSLQEQSAQVVPLSGYFLYNRLLWVGIGLALPLLAYFLFNPYATTREKKQNEEAAATANCKAKPKIHLFPHSWKVFWQLSFSEFKQAFSNIYFLVILLCALLYIFAINGQIGKLYGTETLPMTYQVLEIVGGVFSLFITLITAYYGGELVWKDREQHVQELIDSSPVSNRFLYFSKLLSLGLVQLFFIFLVFVCSVLIQLFKHYTHFEWGVYAQQLLLYTLPSYLLTAVFVLFAQTLARSKMMGHSIVVLYFLLMQWLPSFSFDHHLYLIGVLPTIPYSDMNGFGNSLWRYCIFGLYWVAFHLFLAILTLLFWQRGAVRTWLGRYKECKIRIRPIHKSLSAAALGSWILLGGFIYYNTNILNAYKTKAQLETEKVQYEQRYSHFKKIPHPDLVAVNLHVDLFPESQSMATRGVFTYRNTSSQPIKTFLFNLFSPKIEVDALVWSKATTVVDEQLVAKVYELVEPLQPNEELELQFSLHMQPRGFENSALSQKMAEVDFSEKIVENGTFLQSYAFLPVIGYQPRYELTGTQSRKKQGLAEQALLADVDDPHALQKTYILCNRKHR